jgi:predicted phosphoadenosine phosphosulfate sulfurtransferase
MGIMVHEKIKEYVDMWERRCYKNGIPDEAPSELGDRVPSYKRICLAILNNDLQLTSLGYYPKKSKYYSILKRIEIDARIYKGKQLKLF